MQALLEQQPITAAMQAAYSQLQQTLFTVEQFTAVEPAFTAASLRNQIFKAEPRQTSKGVISGNGLIECGAVLRIGRKRLIDREKYLLWIRQQNGGTQ